jgi:hypothetical protein
MGKRTENSGVEEHGSSVKKRISLLCWADSFCGFHRYIPPKKER